jgi:BirA family transcriptional regulator, biotin operon repressor / biotin---[acetyl-CoA-carboxylase] ligase
VAKVRGTTDQRIDALLTLLAENATFVIPGPKIASEIGVTRSTVWTWVQKLRELGVRVKGHPRTGYHIEKIPDILVPKLLTHRLAGAQFGRRIVHFFKVGSTNTVAMRLGDEGEPHGTVVVAEEQTAGRGRAGRKWLSEKSTGIYASALLRPAIAPTQAPLLTLVAGLAAYDAVADELALTQPGAATNAAAKKAKLDIRWPNDLLMRGRKFSGILTEMHAEPGEIHYAVVGIGINVNQAEMPEEIRGIATSLRIETGCTHSRLELLIRLLRKLDHYYNLFVARGSEPVLARFAEVSTYFSGKRVKITNAHEAFMGTTAGLEASGVLRVQRDDGTGTELVVTGDVAEAK